VRRLLALAALALLFPVRWWLAGDEPRCDDYDVYG
jgi:hypothetical protein